MKYELQHMEKRSEQTGSRISAEVKSRKGYPQAALRVPGEEKKADGSSFLNWHIVKRFDFDFRSDIR